MLRQLFLIIISSVWCLTQPNGDPDSLTSHIANLDQMVQNLQTLSRSQEQKLATFLSIVLSKLATTNDELSAVKGELATLKTEHNFTLSELLSVKDDIITTTAKLAEVSAELSSLNHDYNSTLVEVEGLKNNFLTMKTDFQASRTEVASINTSSTNIEALSSEISILSSNLSLVQTNVEAAKNELIYVESSLKTNEANITSLVSDVAHLMTTAKSIASLQTDVHDIKSDLRKVNFAMLSTQPGKTIMFSALVADDIIIKGIDGSPVKFGKVIYNVGAGYDSNTGVFHAPVAGIHIFTAQIFGKANHEIYLQIKANGNLVSLLHFGDTSTVSRLSSTTVICRLAAGDTVTVEGSYPAAHSETITVMGAGASQFAGILIRADYD